MVNKKVVIICTILAVVTVSTIVFIKVEQFNRQRNEYNQETINYQNTLREIDIANKIDKDTVNDILESKEDNTTQYTNSVNSKENYINTDATSNNILGQEEIDSKNQEIENNDDKAISLVKKEWGETDNTVYYTIDNKTNNVYNISVRSKTTTGTVAEYEVDVKNSKVTLK